MAKNGENTTVKASIKRAIEDYAIPAVVCAVFPWIIPLMLVVVLVACIGSVGASSKYDA